MSTITQAPKMLEYIANIEFSLNFEDKSKGSKVKIGDVVFYDGTTAKFTNDRGEEFSGKTRTLKACITNNWLTLKSKSKENVGHIEAKLEKRTTDEKPADNINYKQPKYDAKFGGDFNQYLNQSKEFAVAHTSKVISEEDRVVRKRATVNDQVSVREVSQATSVSSSTPVQGSVKSHNSKVISSDGGGAEKTITRNFKKASTTEEKKQNKFTVDMNTPRLTDPDNFSADEIQRITTPVIESVDGQDAVVVKKMDNRDTYVQEIEGVTLKNNVNTSGDKEIDYSVKVGSGATGVADLTGVSTQEQANAVTGQEKEPSKYLKLLPADWATLHWVKKEQFIKELTDKEFIKYILNCEPTKAVINACRKRIAELEKPAIPKE
jgi:hypothetical protein